MSLMIGILGRPKTVDREMITFSKAVNDVIIGYGHIPIGIMVPVTNINEPMTNEDINKLYKAIDLCDGIILQGGMDYYQYDLETVKYIHKKNIPLLGICLGMQTIGAFFGGSLGHITNHNHQGIDYVHDVKIENESHLKKVIQKDMIRVNSRHNDMLIEPSDITVVGRSHEVIEAIEKTDSLFLIGVQWHPEDMIKYDEASRRLFEDFFLACETFNNVT